MKIKKTFRIDEKLVDELAKYAEEKGVSQTEALEDAIQVAVQVAVQEPDTCQTAAADDEWKALYFAEKERNDNLSLKLLELSDKVADSLQAAQVLQALDRPALESVEQKKSRWSRLRDAWRG